MSESQTDDVDVADYLSLFRQDGKVWMVVGGGDGIGREVVRALAQVGARVGVLDRDLRLAESVASEIGGFALEANAVDRDSLERAFLALEDHFGRVDGVVDIVGAALIKPILEFRDDDWNTQFDLVLRHALWSVQLGTEAFGRASGRGTIVLVGSTSGFAYTTRQSAYGSAKAALHHLVHCAGRELAADGVRINAVAPGYTKTPRLETLLGRDQWEAVEAQIPRGTAGVPSEIAAPVLFLASEASSYIVGQVILADGGISGGVPSVF